MYLPHQFQRRLATETLTSAERRAADEQFGRASAAVSRLRRRTAGRARTLARSQPRTGLAHDLSKC